MDLRLIDGNNQAIICKHKLYDKDHVKDILRRPMLTLCCDVVVQGHL
jgi:hypothetical protein